MVAAKEAAVVAVAGAEDDPGNLRSQKKRRSKMASYQKFVMMGMTTILIPLGKMVLKKVMNKLTEESEQDSASKEAEAFIDAGRQIARKVS